MLARRIPFATTGPKLRTYAHSDALSMIPIPTHRAVEAGKPLELERAHFTVRGMLEQLVRGVQVIYAICEAHVYRAPVAQHSRNARGAAPASLIPASAANTNTDAATTTVNAATVDAAALHSRGAAEVLAGYALAIATAEGGRLEALAVLL